MDAREEAEHRPVAYKTVKDTKLTPVIGLCLLVGLVPRRSFITQAFDIMVTVLTQHFQTNASCLCHSNLLNILLY